MTAPKIQGAPACQHEFDCKVGVAMFSGKPGQGTVELTGECRHCGAPLVFHGPRGTGNSPMASADRRELRAPVTFGYGPTYRPSPEFRINGPELTPKSPEKSPEPQAGIGREA